MWTPEQRKKWRTHVASLRLHLPAAWPVKIVMVRWKRDDYYGDTWLVRRRKVDECFFRIRIRHGVSFSDAVHTLIHEWGHARSWHHRHDRDENPHYHDEAWGVEYSKAYALVIDGRIPT